jgi:tRNA A37 threonylcarbamoyladenosine dehydratase
VGRIRIVDFDQVRTSNINRQLFALESTIGQQKIEVAKKRILDINPSCQVEAMGCFVHVETLSTVLGGGPELVIDAIDSFGPKVELLSEIIKRKMRVISCMGAALRTDPACVRVGPLSAAKNCPLARQVRKRLRQRELPVDFTCVYSIESVVNLSEEAVAETSEADFYSRGRKRRTLGSLPTLTGIFGLTAANTAIQILAYKLQDQVDSAHVAG